ncbi:MAG TPA: DUF2203 domain-containing protein [Thermoplasmata archaeon]|nr:DUF2203 domain-containing protein [Thermoplasmata archaeon]
MEGSGSDSHDVDLPNPPRLWTPEEANGRVAGLEELLPRLRGWVVRLREVHEETHRLATFWGKDLDAPDHADHGLKVRLDAEWQNLTRRLEEAVQGLRREGIEVKDLESGLIDFYGLQDGEVVFLCWKRGEPKVGFYHTLTGGFANRRAIVEPARRALSSPRGSAARGSP